MCLELEAVMRQSTLHLMLCLFWGALILPTALWWRDSVAWVAAMSLYANLASHWGAFEAAKAKEMAQAAMAAAGTAPASHDPAEDGDHHG